MRPVLFALTFLFTISAFSAVVAAQTGITVNVRDADGGALEGARVIVLFGTPPRRIEESTGGGGSTTITEYTYPSDSPRVNETEPLPGNGVYEVIVIVPGGGGRPDRRTTRFVFVPEGQRVTLNLDARRMPTVTGSLLADDPGTKRAFMGDQRLIDNRVKRAQDAASAGDRAAYDRATGEIDAAIGEADRQAGELRRSSEQFRQASGIPVENLEEADEFIRNAESPQGRALQRQFGAADFDKRLDDVKAYQSQQERIQALDRNSETLRDARNEIPAFGQAKDGVGMVPGMGERNFGEGAFARVSVGVGSFEGTAFPIGTLVTSTGEIGIATNDDRVTTTEFNATGGYNFGPAFGARSARVALWYSFGFGDDERKENLRGENNALTFDQDFNGFTGIAAGVTDAVATSEIDVSHHDVKLRAALDYPLGTSRSVIVSPMLDLSFSGSWQDAHGSYANQTFPGFSSETNRMVDDHLYGAGVGAKVSYFPQRDITIFFGGIISLFYRDTMLESTQNFVCDVCAAGLQSGSIRIDESDDGITYGFGLNAGASARFGGFRVGTSLHWDWIAERGTVDTRVNPSETPTRLTTKRASDFVFRVGGAYKF